MPTKNYEVVFIYFHIYLLEAYGLSFSICVRSLKQINRPNFLSEEVISKIGAIRFWLIKSGQSADNAYFSLKIADFCQIFNIQS